MDTVENKKCSISNIWTLHEFYSLALTWKATFTPCYNLDPHIGDPMTWSMCSPGAPCHTGWGDGMRLSGSEFG